MPGSGCNRGRCRPGVNRRCGSPHRARACGCLSWASSDCSPSWNSEDWPEQIEDDAAELEPGLVVTQDSLVEGVHFRLDWLSWQELGFRAAAVNISDLAASGARPEALLVSLGLPGETELDDVLSLYAGIAEAGVPIRGGDTTEAGFGVRVGDGGRASRARSGPVGRQAGDLLVVTGPLGAAGAAFREQRFVRPPLRVDEGVELARDAHAMLDLSDGLARTRATSPTRSGCRLLIELEQVPLAPGATLEDFGFGEDYELLAATSDPRELHGHRPLRAGQRGGNPDEGRPRSPIRVGAFSLARKCAEPRR